MGLPISLRRPHKYLFRLPAGETQIQRIWAEVDIAWPLDRAMRAESDFGEHALRRELRRVEDVVAILPQPLHHRPIHAFIREQIHADRVATG